MRRQFASWIEFADITEFKRSVSQLRESLNNDRNIQRRTSPVLHHLLLRRHRQYIDLHKHGSDPPIMLRNQYRYDSL